MQAPAALLASFVPMFFIATAFYYMNRADPDAGTTFSWVTRALGPWAGLDRRLGGLHDRASSSIGSLADVGARYTYVLFGWDGAAGLEGRGHGARRRLHRRPDRGLHHRHGALGAVQNVMILAQVGALLLFASSRSGRCTAGDATDGLDRAGRLLVLAVRDRRAADALVSSLLIGVFIYWGWESAVNLTEETEDSRSTPGLAAVISTVILLVTYVAVATAVVAFAGLELLAEFDDDDALFGTLATDVLGSPWDKLVILAIVTSAVASTQTTIIPASRTSFSMARSDALPRGLAAIHPRFRTPHVATIVVAALAVAWYVPANFISENFLFDTLSALALMIAFYYALSGLACVVYYRRELRKSVDELRLHRRRAAARRALLAYLFFESVKLFADPEESYTGQEILGVGVPLVIGVGVPAPRGGAHGALAPRRARALLRAPAARGGRSRRRRRPGHGRRDRGADERRATIVLGTIGSAAMRRTAPALEVGARPREGSSATGS